MTRGLSALTTNAWTIQAFFWLEWGRCGPNPPLVSLGAYPDFLLAALDKAACAVFCKENRMKIATPPTSTGNRAQ